MKYIYAVLLSATLASAADFITGQAARAVIGQQNFTAQASGLSSTALGGVGGIAFANNTLFVVDSNRVSALPNQERVVVYNNMSARIPTPTERIPFVQGVRCPVCIGIGDIVLGQPDFTTANVNVGANGMRTPTAVASDGHILVVADTDNNRVLIWKTIPQGNGASADIVLGQPDFATFQQVLVTDDKSLRGPQGVWIQGTKLFVADTHNNRVMIWNNIPTGNNQPADMVLGQAGFTAVQDPTKIVAPTASNMFSPISVTSDGVHLFVADGGYSRVLIWNSIPTQTQQPADLAVGQPDMVSSTSNNAAALCASTGTAANGNKLYPFACAATLSIPRFALSDGTRLFIADGGNDRVLVFSTIPTASGQRANTILGQLDEFTDRVVDSTDTFRSDANEFRASADTVRTPLSLAWDGANLYVSDPFDRRVLVFSPGTPSLPLNGITNAASLAIYAVGTVTIAGTINAGDTVMVTLGIASTSTSTTLTKSYTYTVLKTDTFDTVAAGLAALINAGSGDQSVLATTSPGTGNLVLTSRTAGRPGNSISLSTMPSSGAKITAAASSSRLTGGQDAAEVAAGTLVTLQGANLSDSTASAPTGAVDLPKQLAGVSVYFDGVPAPLLYVSPTQINAQVPFEVQDSSGISAVVLTTHADHSVTNASAVAIPIVVQNPGIFAGPGADPRPAVAIHASAYAITAVSVDGTITAGNTGTITIGGNAYTYTVLSTDSLFSVRNALIALINAKPSSPVTAAPAGLFTRIVLTAKAAGAAGQGITVATSVSSSATLSLTSLGTGSTCCANATGGLLTAANPAIAGETIVVFATGLGLVGPNSTVVTGRVADTTPNSAISPMNATAGGLTAQVLFDGLAPGMVGVYAVTLQLASNITANLATQLTIAQDVFVSNITTIPVK